MGGGEKYVDSSATSGTSEDISAQQDIPPSEQREIGKTITELEQKIDTPSGSEEEKKNEVAEDNVSQNVSILAPASSQSPETVKPEDTTEGETTQQTGVSAEQEAIPTSVSSHSPETVKPGDTTGGETTQQTGISEQAKNWEYELSIKKEEAGKTPLVCVTQDIQELYQEYEQGSEIYRQKIMKLAEKHSHIRRCRGDGNCFYRAFGFAWFERLLDSKDKSLRQSALDTLSATKSTLVTAGYQLIAYDDAYDIIEKQMKAVANGERDEDMLLSIFQTDEISNYIVFYLRLITAAYLKLHREEYEPFLEFEIGMDQFCANFVEVMDQEADHIHVIALTKALKVPVEIAYMSGSDAMEQANFHEFCPDEKVSSKPLVLLYRPGHYDILYRRE